MTALTLSCSISRVTAVRRLDLVGLVVHDDRLDLLPRTSGISLCASCVPASQLAAGVLTRQTVEDADLDDVITNATARNASEQQNQRKPAHLSSLLLFLGRREVHPKAASAYSFDYTIALGSCSGPESKSDGDRRSGPQATQQVPHA